MTHEQFERELGYGAAMLVAKELYGGGLINHKEYVRINTIFRQKLSPPISGLIRSKP